MMGRPKIIGLPPREKRIKVPTALLRRPRRRVCNKQNHGGVIDARTDRWLCNQCDLSRATDEEESTSDSGDQMELPL